MTGPTTSTLLQKIDSSPSPRVRNVQALYRALTARDLRAAEALLVPEPVWDITEGAPDGGVYRGLPEVFGGFYRRLGDRFPTFAVHPELFVDEAPFVVAVGTYAVLEEVGQPEKSIRFAHVFSVTDTGLIRGVWQVADTARFGV